MTNYSSLPEHMQDTARLYVERGIPGGSFFTAVVSNDFKGAFAKADDANTAAMREWAMWLYSEAPSICQGSMQKVADWIESGGTKGRADEVAA